MTGSDSGYTVIYETGGNASSLSGIELAFERQTFRVGVADAVRIVEDLPDDPDDPLSRKYRVTAGHDISDVVVPGRSSAKDVGYSLEYDDDLDKDRPDSSVGISIEVDSKPCPALTPPSSTQPHDEPSTNAQTLTVLNLEREAAQERRLACLVRMLLNTLEDIKESEDTIIAQLVPDVQVDKVPAVSSESNEDTEGWF
ncbi:hypothetical protein PENSPDRAFT_749749 [Peniophora sp. CONT]|nr:hypothetical protein PENSPDRAFT_749749 [Peniophora sp. CONT]